MRPRPRTLQRSPGKSKFVFTWKPARLFTAAFSPAANGRSSPVPYRGEGRAQTIPAHRARESAVRRRRTTAVRPAACTRVSRELSSETGRPQSPHPVTARSYRMLEAPTCSAGEQPAVAEGVAGAGARQLRGHFSETRGWSFCRRRWWSRADGASDRRSCAREAGGARGWACAGTDGSRQGRFSGRAAGLQRGTRWRHQANECGGWASSVARRSLSQRHVSRPRSQPRRVNVFRKSKFLCLELKGLEVPNCKGSSGPLSVPSSTSTSVSLPSSGDAGAALVCGWGLAGLGVLPLGGLGALSQPPPRPLQTQGLTAVPP
ncbi:hypothetical protein HJG60_008354 [Phyllostomus discolor]|uniref:Uncharacterized protein n=1 Tax=Phyllostomus discolor TaxID=89673 RepID=A0A833ZCV1_9CHIR|nr:hypothetical protein HJG60_008354 [Phyllostomus discolor]